MFTIPLIAVASLLLSFFPLSEKVEYSIAEISIAKKASLVFSIGQIELHKQGGTIIPARLAKTPDEQKVMMISDPFTVSSGDSIYFRRTMSISSPGARRVDEKTLPGVKFEKAYQAMEIGSVATGVKLHDTLFNKLSSILVITDVMYQNDTTIIASLDTITVKKNASGFLKAYTAAYRPESITAALKNINPSRPVVVRVWMQMLLPEQATFAITTKSQLRDKKAYNMVTTNPSMVVPGYARKH
jgi:hypothetical protein